MVLLEHDKYTDKINLVYTREDISVVIKLTREEVRSLKLQGDRIIDHEDDS